MNGRGDGCAVELNVPGSVLKGIVKIDETFVVRLCGAVERAVSDQIRDLKDANQNSLGTASGQKRRPIAPLGVDLTDEELDRVEVLRSALLMGRVPKDTGLLIDAKTTAKLLNVSVGTLYRLGHLQAVPRPIKIGRAAVRWRLAEILRWIESGCPSLKHWRYPDDWAQRLGRCNPVRRRSQDQRP